MASPADYREIAVPRGLAPWVVCAWRLTAAPGPDDHVHRVLPDGCIDLVVRDAQGLQVAGPDTRAALAAVAGGASAVGVRMRPGAAPALLGICAEAVRDARVSAAEVLGPDADRLEETLLATRSPDARAGELIAWLAHRAAAAPAPDRLVAAAAGLLEADPGRAVAALAAELGVGERHLRRRVVALVGYGPKRLARVRRLQRALELAAARPRPGWAEVAARAGYADQAHLANDCRELAGVPPSALAAG